MDFGNFDHAKKIVWLASYPKSGNTWLRAFLAALLGDGTVDINDMKSDGIYSSRSTFSHFTDLDSTLLTNEEIALLQPAVYQDYADTSPEDRLFIKIHDAYTYNTSNVPIIPTAGTFGIIYIIRNPLDIAGSLANHLQTSLDFAVKQLNTFPKSINRPQGYLNTTEQLDQLLLNWSEHVASWIDQKNCPVLTIRYEDMITDALQTFSGCCAFIGLEYNESEIAGAITASAFDNLKQQEEEKKFKEKKIGSSFFRQGKMGLGRSELSETQIRSIIAAHSGIMSKFGYL